MNLELHEISEVDVQRQASITPALPARLKILYVTAPQEKRLDLTAAFAADSATSVSLVEAVGPTAALEQLGQQVFDAVFVLHAPPTIDALELVAGLRGGGMEEPLILFGADEAEAIAPLVYEVGANGYACVTTVTTRGLLWMVTRAIECCHLRQENRKLAQIERQRLQHDCDEAQRLLKQQCNILSESNGETSSEQRREPELSEPIIQQYRQLLRTHVIMGAGNLEREIYQLTEQLLEVCAAPREVILLHTSAADQLIRGMGTKGSRHILARADLLILELLAQLSSGYRSRYLETASR